MTPRNRIILIISLVALALFSLGIYSYLTLRETNPSEPVTLREFFTFGRSDVGTPTGTETPGTSPAPSPTIITSGELIPIRQISTRPIAGAAIVMAERTTTTGTIALPSDTPVLEWSRNLKEGDTGADVRELQVFLNQDIGPKDVVASTRIAATGPGSPGNESTYFGAATKAAVVHFQERYAPEILAPQNLTVGTGIADERTRAKIHTLKAALPQKESALAVRYVERATGNVFQTFIDAIAEKRISNTTIPKIHEAIFGVNGTSVLLRFLADDNASIVTFSGTLPSITEGGDSALMMQGGFLDRNIRSLSFSPDGTRFFYLTNTEQSAIGTTATIAGASKNQLWSSAYTEWLPQWVNDRVIGLTTKPSSTVPGYAYLLDTKTREFSKVLGNIQGLTTLWSPNGKKILYSRTSASGTSITLSIYDVDAKRSSDLGIDTLPEKCVWATDNSTIYCAVPQIITAGQYPDIWYQGVASFSDSIWKLDTVTSLFKQIANPQETLGTQIDGINLLLDPRGSNLFLTNKRDSTLWHIAL